MREDDGFADYVERHGRHLVLVAYLLTGDERVAHDVVQRALSRAWLSWGGLSELPDPDTYLLRAVVTSPGLRHAAPADGLLARLPHEQRAAVVLRFFEGLPDGRMAAAMDTQQDTAHRLLDAGVAALGDADIGGELRARADAVAVESLLPGVRAAADRQRRLRLAGVVGAAVCVVCVVAGVADLALTSSGTAPVGAARPTLDPAALTGRTWYLVSWTTGSGTVVRPTTPTPPTLVFDSRTSARTTDPGTTTWTFQLGKGVATGFLVPRDTGSATAASTAVDGALATVLAGNSIWQVTGSTLVFSRFTTALTFSSNPAAAQHG